MGTTYEMIRVEEEANLLAYLEDIFSAPSITQILTIKDRVNQDNLLATYFKGYHFPLSEKFGAELHGICRDVVKHLKLVDLKVEFYVANDPVYNAFALFNHNDEQPHYIVLNSGLVEKLDSEELRFVVGHELGHLIFRHSILDRVIGVAYKDLEESPPSIQCLHDLWMKLREVSADRMGVLAVGSLEPALSAMFKMSSGMSMTSLKMNARAYLDMVNTLMADISNTIEYVYDSHPMNPVRVKALELFFESRAWKKWSTDGHLIKDKALELKMDTAIGILRKVPKADKERAEYDFLSSAGFLIVTADEEIKEGESTYLLNVLSQYHFWPMTTLQEYSKWKNKKKVQQIVKKSASWLVANSPESARTMLQWLIMLLSCDGKIDQRELEVFLRIAESHLKIPSTEVIEMLIQGLEEKFRPLM